MAFTSTRSPEGGDTDSAGRDATVKTVHRVAGLLKCLATAGPAGARLTDVARDLGMTKPTAHRLLAALAQAGMARHDTETRRYRLGELSTVLGQSSARISVSSEARPSLLRLAAATQDTVYVSVREGSAAVCVGCEIGDFPIRTITLAPGDQRPLGVGAGSMALLAFLADAEIETILARNEGWVAKNYPHFTSAALREEVRVTRSRGYSLSRDRVVPGMSAIGVPALCHGGRPVGAFSVAAITERIAGSREAQLVALLRAEAEHLASVFCQPAALGTIETGVIREIRRHGRSGIGSGPPQ